MADHVEISGLRANCIIGVDESERLTPQMVEIGIVLDFDLAAAGESDDIADSVDYRSLAEAVVDAAESSSYRLIEALATRVADICLAVSKVEAVKGHDQEARRAADSGLSGGDNPAKAADGEVSVWGRQPHLDEQVKARMRVTGVVDVVQRGSICRSTL